MADIAALLSLLTARFSEIWERGYSEYNEVTIEIPREQIRAVGLQLRDDPDLKFEMLMDVCGVDYLHYGCDEWTTHDATSTGFERGATHIDDIVQNPNWHKPRFAVVYHLLSIEKNWRLRMRAFVPEHDPLIDSVTEIWPSADWYEREAFDLFGILFKDHPDLRRILTDYGFIGHPFRKDFPLIGEVAMRYDAKQKRVVYEPVDIEPRTLVPKVIRKEAEGESA